VIIIIKLCVIQFISVSKFSTQYKLMLTFFSVYFNIEFLRADRLGVEEHIQNRRKKNDLRCAQIIENRQFWNLLLTASKPSIVNLPVWWFPPIKLCITQFIRVSAFYTLYILILSS
jgi:hypothetical protein